MSDRMRVPAEDYREIVEALPVAVSICTAVRNEESEIVDFVLEYMNPVAEGIVGVPREQILGSTLKEIVPNLEETGLFADYVSVVTSGRTLLKGPFPFEGEVSGRSLSGYFDLHLSRYGDGFISVSLDVTEKVRAQEELVVAEAAAIQRREQEKQAKELSDTVLHWLAEATHALDSREMPRAQRAMSEALKAGSRIVTDLRRTRL